MSPFLGDALRQAAEDMGTMDYTPYLLMRGWQFHSHAGQPGVDYLRDPLTGAVIVNLNGVSRQLLRDQVISDPSGFTLPMNYVAKLPEPLLTEVREYRARQAAAGRRNHQPVPEPAPEPAVEPAPEPVPEEPQQANPILLVQDVLQEQPVTRPKKRKTKKPATPIPEKNPLARTFNYGDRE